LNTRFHSGSVLFGTFVLPAWVAPVIGEDDALYVAQNMCVRNLR
jgi:hypothetical protein